MQYGFRIGSFTWTLYCPTQANMPSANENPNIVEYISKKLQNQQTMAIGPINPKPYREVINTSRFDVIPKRH